MRADRACTASSTVPSPSLAARSASRSAGFWSSATCRIWSASAWKSALLATKSVSQSSSTIMPPAATTRPLLVARSARLPTSFAPLMRSSSTAFSMSPSDCSSAFLQSIIPEPVSSRSRFTSAAV